ncbi:hypothetical protein WJX73_001206 [Symbiochloris irregularis]|uniref:Protein kinase domain-containing protein n=1 Tax=Symbiochloris irregularis TaxID=706552 RepID=A0AAW1NVU3_9CHLO
MRRNARTLPTPLCATTGSTGVRSPANSLSVSRKIGQGSFGQVFEGTLRDAGQEPERVVLKRVRSNVAGAEHMGRMEHLLNVYCSKKAKDSIADFIGYCEVTQAEAKGGLTAGLWLMWRYEGTNTLADYLKRRNCLEALSRDLQVPQAAVVATVMHQIFQAANAMHAAGLVHRDIKPANLIFSEQERRFKLIDLGACADLRNGTNYIPDESILDPEYCPPEQYCMPTDAPHLSKQMRPLSLAMSPLLWARHKPDRFDSFSAGLVMMQLAVPSLRSPAGFRNFNGALRRLNCDLLAWRASARLSPAQTAVLDADNGAGWDLAAALLRPRMLEVTREGIVKFINTGRLRLPIKAGSQHRFCRQVEQASALQRRASDPLDAATSSAAAPASKGGLGILAAASAAWQAASQRVGQLELRVQNQAEAVEMQTQRVTRMREDIRTGQAGDATKVQLNRAETLLERMQGRLTGLRSELSTTASNAQGMVSGIARAMNLSGTTGGTEKKTALPSIPSASARDGTGGTASDRSGSESSKASWGGNFWKRGTGSASQKAVRVDLRTKTGSTKQALPAQPAASESQKGWGFGGFGFGSVAALAGTLSREAGRAMEKMEADARARAMEKAEKAEAAEAFSEHLRTMRPAVGVATTWQQIAPKVRKDLRFQALDAQERRLLFETYKEGLQQMQALAVEQSRAEFKTALEGVEFPPAATWGQVAALAPKLAGFTGSQGLLVEADRRAAFIEFQTLRRKEAGFRRLLQTASPAVRADEDWRAVRRRFQGTAVFKDLAEVTRRTIIKDHLSQLAGEAEQQLAEASLSEGSAQGGPPQVGGQASQEEAPPGVLMELLKEQRQMKAQYEANMKAMTAKLKVMEQQLQDKNGRRQASSEPDSDYARGLDNGHRNR